MGVIIFLQSSYLQNHVVFARLRPPQSKSPGVQHGASSCTDGFDDLVMFHGLEGGWDVQLHPTKTLREFPNFFATLGLEDVGCWMRLDEVG